MRIKVHCIIALIMGICCILVGCASPTCTKSHAIEIASKEFGRRGGNGKIENNASFIDGEWVVTIWILPATPGGFITVEISKSGKLLNYEAGR